VSTHLENVKQLFNEHNKLVGRKNTPVESGNGIYQRYTFPVLTAAHAPVHWRYDLNPQANPLLLERIGVNAAFNSGAMIWKGKIVLVVRVEGNDRKSFFALAESDSGVDNFRFRDYPIELPQTHDPDTNVYDMRLVQHEMDGSMVCFVQSAGIHQQKILISLLQPLNVALFARTIWNIGKGFRIW
jgi:4-O-beta-D-mannosyl-D-glucose phosphorylase